LGGDQEADYRAAIRLGNDFERSFHDFYIHVGAYACQGIYKNWDGERFRWGGAVD
jgi:hypothetical protein